MQAELETIDGMTRLVNMNGLTIGLILPFLGTVLGSACVFLMKREMAPMLQKTLMGFAAGVMVAASVWSLLIPSMEMTGDEGFMRVVPASVGFAAGILFLLLLDVLVPHQHIDSPVSEAPSKQDVEDFKTDIRHCPP